MGRKRNVCIREFFETTDCMSKCKKCGVNYKGQHFSTLRKHVFKKHYDLYEEQEQEQREQQEDRVSFKKVKFTVEMSAGDVVKSCVDLVAKEGQSFALFDSNAFRVLTEPIFQGLALNTPNSKNIINWISEESNRIRNYITRIVKGRFISLKMDIASRHDRAVLGINMQFIMNKKICVFTLAMLELHKKHTAENLKKALESVLAQYEINKWQIYSITTDNGRNILKAASLLSPLKTEFDENLSDADDATSRNYEHIIRNISFNGIHVIRCAAHTLQLAVKDFLAMYTLNTINRARDVVKTLRTNAFRYSLIDLSLEKPVLDVVTRWNSTFLMLHSLLNLKGFCEENLDCQTNLREEEWEEIENLVKVLAPLNKATIKLQKVQLLISDFYKEWLELKLELQQQKTSISELLLGCVKKREEAILETEHVFAALFLDPRLRRLLTPEQKQRAKGHLKQIVHRFHQNERTSENNQQGSNPDTEFLFDETTQQSDNSLLKESIRSLEIDSSDDEDSSPVSSCIAKAYSELDSYHERRVDVNADLMKYWESNKFKNPMLRKLAFIVQAVPATQVSVERAFSALRIILSDLRCNLAENHMRDILFIRLNSLDNC